MTADQLDQITRRYLAASFDEIEDRLALEWEGPGLDAHRFDLNDEAHRLSGLLANAELGEFAELARTLLLEGEDTTRRKLARRLIEAKLEAVTAELKALAGNPLRRPTEHRGATAEAPKETPRVSEVARLYGDERVSLRKWSPKTEHLHRTILQTVAELLGDPQIGDVTKEDMRQLGHAITQLPANMGKKFPGKTPREVLKATEGDPSVPRLEPRSVNKYQQLTRSLFAWATEHDTIPKNPAEVLRDVKERRARDDRRPFTDDDLRTYFAKLDQEPKRPELRWLPRIMAYSGLRLGEAAQLTTADIRREGEAWVIDVNDDTEGKQLKTPGSRRLVPVHPRLVELGLLKWTEGAPAGHLFDAQWRTTDNPKRGAVDKLSKLLARRLRDAGVTDPKKTAAHSFRHTVSARLKDAGVPEYQIADLLGHELDSMPVGRYGKTTDLAALAGALGQLRLPV
ncbi:MAG TPA: tyrosine-type recombinase/integrase [Luteimonas sp.]|nr:tyrosine-type recombinase/integrase [Luteimonas sp.]